jgi:hypothetical protein
MQEPFSSVQIQCGRTSLIGKAVNAHEHVHVNVRALIKTRSSAEHPPPIVSGFEDGTKLRLFSTRKGCSFKIEAPQPIGVGVGVGIGVGF